MRDTYASTLFCAGVVALATATLAAGPPATRPGDAVYRLAVGQELTYADHQAVDYGQVHLATRSTTVYHVVGRTADGVGWRVIGTVATDGRGTDVSSFDLWPDGRLGAGAGDAAGDHFPPLPPTPTAARWDRADDDGDRDVFRRAPATRPAVLAFAAEKHVTVAMMTGAMFRSTQSRQGTFDPAAGLLVQASRQSSKDMGRLSVRETATTDLTGTALRPAADAARFAADAEAYRSAQTDFGLSVAAGQGTPNREAVMVRGLEPLLALRRAHRLVDATLATALRQTIDADQRLIARTIGILNRPAAAWDLADLAGRRHTLAGQRGRVVVLDFWFRGCPPCVRAMPDLRRLADHYAGRPVSLFGMNLDADADDARAVVDRYGITYPTLRLAGDGGRTVLSAYQVCGCPSLVVIGPDGIVRHVHVGYDPSTHDQIAGEVDALLATAGPMAR